MKQPAEASPKLAIFCGAGASAPHYPLMAGFATAVQKSPHLNDETKHAFSRIQAELGDMAVLVGADPRNIEHLISLIDTTSLTRPNLQISADTGRIPITQCTQIIRRCISALYAPACRQPPGTLSMLLAYALSHGSCGVVTTNYDMNVEISASLSGIGVRCSEAIERALESSSQSQAKSLYAGGMNDVLSQKHTDPSSVKRWLTLSKLHGSINWQLHDQVLHVEDRVWPTYNLDRTQYTVPYLGDIGTLRSDSNDEKLILGDQLLVAPSVLKPRLNDGPILAEQWQLAGHILHNAEMLWIVGYSFPASDSFMKYFFASCLHHNTNLRQIVIIDPNAASIATRVPDLFASSTFGHLVRLVPFKLGDIQPPWIKQLLADEWQPSLNDAPIDTLRDRLAARMLLRGELPMQ